MSFTIGHVVAIIYIILLSFVYVVLSI